MNAPADPRIDAHLHLWDPAAADYAWLDAAPQQLRATFTPEQARAELDACGIDRAVLVQAEDSELDTELMLAIATEHPWVCGVVGWVDLVNTHQVSEQLDRWQRHEVFCGVRHLVHVDPREDLLDRPDVRASLSLLAARDLTFDVPDAWPRHLRSCANVAAAVPALRVVVDHLGKPPWRGADWAGWRTDLAGVARHPNTVAKVSGLQSADRPMTVEAVRPAWDVALELFGPARLMWGSDWPMTVVDAGYGGTWGVMSALVGELSREEQTQLLGGTATVVYRLGGSRTDASDHIVTTTLPEGSRSVDGGLPDTYIRRKSISEELSC